MSARHLAAGGAAIAAALALKAMNRAEEARTLAVPAAKEITRELSHPAPRSVRKAALDSYRDDGEGRGTD